MSLKPIIIQNFFRSGGSYLYDILNNQNDILGFYEPFHESLGSKERIQKEKENFNKLKKKLGHTNKEFYFQNFPENDEYILNFNSEKFERLLFLSKRNDYEKCKNYLEYLIELAKSKNKIPLFKVNRLYLNPDILESIISTKILLYIFVSFLKSFRETHSSTLCIVLLTNPNSRHGEIFLINLASEVPPVVENFGFILVIFFMIFFAINIVLFGLVKNASPLAI